MILSLATLNETTICGDTRRSNKYSYCLSVVEITEQLSQLVNNESMVDTQDLAYIATILEFVAAYPVALDSIEDGEKVSFIAGIKVNKL